MDASKRNFVLLAVLETSLPACALLSPSKTPKTYDRLRAALARKSPIAVHFAKQNMVNVTPGFNVFFAQASFTSDKKDHAPSETFEGVVPEVVAALKAALPEHQLEAGDAPPGRGLIVDVWTDGRVDELSKNDQIDTPPFRYQATAFFSIRFRESDAKIGIQYSEEVIAKAQLPPSEPFDKRLSEEEAIKVSKAQTLADTLIARAGQGTTTFIEKVKAAGKKKTG